MYGAKLQRLILRKQSGGMNILGGGGSFITDRV